MVTSKLIGGLGNQMFQYAAGRSLATRLKTGLTLDASEFKTYWRPFALASFVLDPDVVIQTEPPPLQKQPYFFGWSSLFRSREKHVKESKFSFNENFLDLRGRILIEGYWQSPKYFDSIRVAILSAFQPKLPLSSRSQSLLDRIRNCSNPISLHVRRGDYVTNPNASQFHGICSVAYYKNAVERILSERTDATVFVFSDDIEWTKQNLNLKTSTHFAEAPLLGMDYEDIYLMSQCSDFVIANSSFSWWGAWLSTRADKIVIAPKPWFKDVNTPSHDLLPDEWLRMDIQ